MNQKETSVRGTARETDPTTLAKAIERIAQRRTLARGEVDFPCVPALLDTYLAQLLAMWEALGKKFAPPERENLRNVLDLALTTGFEASSYARMLVSYEAHAPPVGVQYTIRLKENTIEQHYAHWLSERKPPLFGNLPDAKVIELASALGDPRSAPVLDLGAGTGRNAVALARRGHPTCAVELVAELADEMNDVKQRESLPLEVVVADVLSPDFVVERARYKMAVLSEVTPHFRGVEELGVAFEKMADALMPSGIALLNVFVASDDYVPDLLAAQVSEVSWSRIFTRDQIALAAADFPFDAIAEESVHDHEQRHASADAWPPTSWFVDWSQGRNVFDLPLGRAPVELRWLVYRRR